MLRIAVIGHAEHVTIGRVPSLPGPGNIAHLEEPRSFAGGGGAVAFAQLAKSSAEVHFFTALGADDAATQVAAQLHATRARIHAARRAAAHTRDVVLVTPDGERTIVVVGEPPHPERTDALPWDERSARSGLRARRSSRRRRPRRPRSVATPARAPLMTRNIQSSLIVLTIDESKIQS
jgi:sugar/nucleoside kinase (ribokinase family)